LLLNVNIMVIGDKIEDMVLIRFDGVLLTRC
jgi:hypothetical protein